MTVPDDASFDVGHRAPDRESVSLRELAAALLLAPLAWGLQLLMIYGFASPACEAATRPGMPAGPQWIAWAVPAVNVVALVLALVAIALALANLRRTRPEPDGEPGGVMHAGAGRSRFLAIWGLWTGVLFLLAIAFNTIAVFWMGLCEL